MRRQRAASSSRAGDTEGRCCRLCAARESYYPTRTGRATSQELTGEEPGEETGHRRASAAADSPTIAGSALSELSPNNLLIPVEVFTNKSAYKCAPPWTTRGGEASAGSGASFLHLFPSGRPQVCDVSQAHPGTERPRSYALTHSQSRTRRRARAHEETHK